MECCFVSLSLLSCQSVSHNFVEKAKLHHDDGADNDVDDENDDIVGMQNLKVLCLVGKIDRGIHQL